MSEAAKMRRADKEITDPDELHRILDEAPVLHLGLIDAGRPYVVPLNFAREDDTLPGRESDHRHGQPPR